MVAVLLGTGHSRFTASILAHGFPLGRAFPRLFAVALAPSQPLTAAGLLRIFTGFLAMKNGIHFSLLCYCIPRKKSTVFVWIRATFGRGTAPIFASFSLFVAARRFRKKKVKIPLDILYYA